MMKAWVHNRYGTPDVLELKDVEVPTIADDHVLVKVRACALNPYDWHMLRGDPRLMRPTIGGLRGPRDGWIPGADVSGVVEAVGPAVTRFSVGDEVYGIPGRGGLAEYVGVTENSLAINPRGLSYVEAAGIPMAFLTALQGLRDHGRLHQGQRILVIGAGGGIGTFAVQLATVFGASVIAAVCSPDKANLVRSLGATRVFDYTAEDFSLSGETYDLIVDTVGGRGVRALHRVLTPRGTLILLGGGRPGSLVGPLPQIVRAKFLGTFSHRRTALYIAKKNPADLNDATALIEAKKMRPIVGRRFPFSEAPDALRLLEQGHPTGKIVVTM
jgi:NADPH:quinone reductase-like Zn-dependent oxidoreductase